MLQSTSKQLPLNKEPGNYAVKSMRASGKTTGDESAKNLVGLYAGLLSQDYT